MATQTFTETFPAVNRNAILTEALTERSNRELEKMGMPQCRTPRASLWWCVLGFASDTCETSPLSAHWCFSEEHAEEEVERYHRQGYYTQICATYVA